MTRPCVSAPPLRSQSRDGSALEEERGSSVLLLEIAGQGHRTRIPDGPTGGFPQVGPRLDHELAEERLLALLELEVVVGLARREAAKRDEGAASHAGGREVPGAGAEEPGRPARELRRDVLVEPGRLGLRRSGRPPPERATLAAKRVGGTLAARLQVRPTRFVGRRRRSWHRSAQSVRGTVWRRTPVPLRFRSARLRSLSLFPERSPRGNLS